MRAVAKILLIDMALAIGCVVVLAYMLSKQPDQIVQEPESVAEDLATVNCYQVGRDLQPTIECLSDRPGFFFWEREVPVNNWVLFYYTERATLGSGFQFTTNPRLVRVTFVDLDQNEYQIIIDLWTDLKVCEQPLCLRV